MRLSAPSLLPLISCLFICISFAIYVDEAYQVDYQHALLGVPQAHNTFFHRPSTNSKASLLYTLSDSGLIGAINPRDGVPLWRQRLGEGVQNCTGKGFLKAADGSNLVFSAFCGTLKAWDATDGRLAWIRQVTGKMKALETLEGEIGVNEVFVLSQEGGAKGVARCFSAETGTVKWAYVDPSGDVPHSLIFLEGKLFYVSLHTAILKGSKIKTTELDPTTGKQVGQPDTLNSESEVLEDLILYAGRIGDVPAIIWSDKSFNMVRVASLLKKHTVTIDVPSNNGSPIDKIIVHAPRNTAAQPHFLLHFQGLDSHWAQIYHLDPATGAAKKACELPSQAGTGAFSTSNQGSDVYFVRHTASEVSLVSSTSAHSLSVWKVPTKSQAETTERRDISHAVTEVVRKVGPKFSIRSALALRSGDWELIRNGESLWVRPESLTGVVAAAFTEIPQGEDLAQELAVEGQYNFILAYAHRLRRHIRDIQYLPGWIEEYYNSLLAIVSGNEASGSRRSLRRDKFGFNKIVVFATGRGRLAALDTGNHGRVIWNNQAVTLRLDAKWDVIGMNAEDDSLLIRAAGGEFLRVESSTGKIIEYQRGVPITGVNTLAAVIDVRGQQALIPINTDGSLGRIPQADFGEGTIVVTRSDGNRLKGWSLSKPAKAVLVWQFVPFAGEIREVLHRPAHDPVASMGKALGDRNVLFKYLNPNVILITAVDTQASTVTFYLLDSISGALLYSVSHSDVDINQSISSTISENFFAYSLFSKTVSQDPLQVDQQNLKGYQLVISELYESPYPNDRGPLGSSSNFSSTQPMQAGEDETRNSPHVISQSFFIPGPISHLSMTSTLQGITPRSLLCVVPHLNALIAIPRHIINPRRPVGRDPTTAEIEEGLFRYNAMLEFEPKWSLNHKREYMGLSNVLTNPSLLESTSLIFAYGDADIFGTRLSPIGGFDILGKGFSKLQLVVTVTALAVGTSVLAPLVRLLLP
ncbi:MAG: hypothetical protein Q9217_002564 [Psora testacea]